MSNSATSVAAKPGVAPSHVLLATGKNGLTSRLKATDLGFRKDYFAERMKTYAPVQNKNKKAKKVAEKQPPTSDLPDIWEGVSNLERELIDCCETHHETDEFDKKPAGVLDPSKELKFVGLLAFRCHSVASRSLACAILERTLETFVVEEEREALRKQNETMSPLERQEQDVGIHVDEDDGLSERERRKRRRDEISSENDDDSLRLGEKRLESFLGAGGLRVLNRWLVEILNPVRVASGKADHEDKRSDQPSPYRPMVIPVLSILEHMPVEKKLAMNSKINKQIKRIGKLMDSLVEKFESKTLNDEDRQNMKNWSLTSRGIESVRQVQAKNHSVMDKWLEQVKKRRAKVADPFEAVKKKLASRYKRLKAFDAGERDRPAWLPDYESMKKGKKSKKPELDKHVTLQRLAAKERQNEREELQKSLVEAQNERRKTLARLREQMRKKKEESLPERNDSSKRKGKWVSWRDGLTSQFNRNRAVLEQVHIFTKEVVEDTGDSERNQDAAGTSSITTDPSEDLSLL